MIQAGDALLVTDIQRDFLPGGSLAVPSGGRIIEPVNRCLDAFAEKGLPVLATRDWHPADHCSFKERGGLWPAHCVAGTPGSLPPPEVRLPERAIIVPKATNPRREAYSGFQDTDLEQRLCAEGAARLVIAGLAGDYCVSATALEALRKGFAVVILWDAVASIDEARGRRALAVLEGEGAALVASARYLAAPALTAVA